MPLIRSDCPECTKTGFMFGGVCKDCHKKKVEKGNGNMIKKMTWNEFQSSGLLGFTNQFLHLFGMALIVEADDNGEIQNACPAYCKFRGFDEDSTDGIYKNMTKYLENNIGRLKEEVNS